MSVAIKKAVVAALESVTVYQDKIDALKRLCASVEDVRGTILPYVASFYGVALVAGQRKAIGRKVMDSTAEKYITAKQAWMRLSTAIEGNKPKSTTPVAVPKKLLAQGVNIVIEQSMTAAQFNAWVAAIRATVTFAK